MTDNVTIIAAERGWIAYPPASWVENDANPERAYSVIAWAIWTLADDCGPPEIEVTAITAEVGALPAWTSLRTPEGKHALKEHQVEFY